MRTGADAGVVISGKVGMHTSPVYAEDVYVGSHCGIDRGAHRATFIVPVNAPGVTVLCRKISARHPNPFMAPLSSRYDELDAQMWLDDVFIPWERVFLRTSRPSRWPPGSSGISSTAGSRRRSSRSAWRSPAPMPWGSSSTSRRSSTSSTSSSRSRLCGAARPPPSSTRSSPRRASSPWLAQ